MPLRKQQQEFIRDEVTSQLSEAVDSFRPHGWRRVTFFLREWGIAGAVLTVIVALLGITLAALYQSFSHVKEEAEFRTNTKNSFEKLEGKLSDIEITLLNMRAAEAPRAAVGPNGPF